MYYKFIITFILVPFFISCSNNSNKNNINSENINIASPETQYIEAMGKFDNQQFEEAIIIFSISLKIFNASSNFSSSNLSIPFK